MLMLIVRALTALIRRKLHFNTSHVNVNPKGETGEQGPKGFQYISC